jgi:hypothetical protein
MYRAYYVLRRDGDGDLCAILESGESICEELAAALRDAIETKLNASGEEWFARGSGDSDFPDVWDLRVELTEWEGEHPELAGSVEDFWRWQKRRHLKPL